MKPYFVVEAYSNVGRIRRNNEDNYYVNGKHLENAALDDYFIIDIPSQKGVFGVFDGMGGQSKGEFASLTAATTLSGYQHDLMKNPDGFIEDYVKNANSRICAEIQKTQSRIGTTMAIAVINEDKLKVYNIGDSRVYYFRDGNIYQLSKDHTTVNQLVEAGLMTREQAAVDKRKNELSQHLGIMPSEMVIQPFVSQEVEWGDNDVLVICSDGVTDALSDEEIKTIVNQCSQKGFFAEHLVKTAIRKGSKDNATAVVVQACDKNGIKSVKKKPVSGGITKAGKKIERWVIIAALVVCLMVGGLAGVLFNTLSKSGDVDESDTSVSETTADIVVTPTQEDSGTTLQSKPLPTDDTTTTTEPTSESTQPRPSDENLPELDEVYDTPLTRKIKLNNNGQANLRSSMVNDTESVALTLNEPKEVKVIGYKQDLYFWVYIELDNQFYWVTTDEIDGNIPSFKVG